MSAKFEIHFHAPVGQNINNVKHMDVYVGKDGMVHVMDAEQLNIPTSEEKSIEPKKLTGIDAGIMAVHHAHICKAADWAVVVKILEELGEWQTATYKVDAERINEVCGENVTAANSLSRSPIYTKITGKYPEWKVKPDEQNRETAGKLQTYLKIGEIFMEGKDG